MKKKTNQSFFSYEFKYDINYTSIQSTIKTDIHNFTSQKWYTVFIIHYLLFLFSRKGFSYMRSKFISETIRYYFILWFYRLKVLNVKTLNNQ